MKDIHSSAPSATVRLTRRERAPELFERPAPNGRLVALDRPLVAAGVGTPGVRSVSSTAPTLRISRMVTTKRLTEATRSDLAVFRRAVLEREAAQQAAGPNVKQAEQQNDAGEPAKGASTDEPGHEQAR